MLHSGVSILLGGGLGGVTFRCIMYNDVLGLARVLTTIFHQMVEESALLDLKHLLMEAQQRVPPVLMALEDPTAEMDEVGEPGCSTFGA